MGQTLTEIAQTLKDANKKVQCVRKQKSSC